MVTRAIALVLVVVGLTACGSGKNAATLAADQKKADMLAIEQIEKTWHQASSTHDVDLMMTIWSDNAESNRDCNWLAKICAGVDELVDLGLV